MVDFDHNYKIMQNLHKILISIISSTAIFIIPAKVIAEEKNEFINNSETILGLEEYLQRSANVPKNSVNLPTSSDNLIAPAALDNNSQELPTLEDGTTITQTTRKIDSSFKVFPVGIEIDNRNVVDGILIRGSEDGSQAVNFDDWLVPFSAVVEALKLNVKSLPDGQLEVSNSGLVTRINPKQLFTDPQLGLVFSIQDLKRLFGVEVKFDINKYAITINPAWSNQSTSVGRRNDRPIVLDGLPGFQPGKLSIAAIEQKVSATGSGSNSTTTTGDFLAVGTIFDGSWFLRTEQPKLRDSKTWRIQEAQYLRQTDRQDYFVGSHPTFWSNLGASDFWGFTYIQRQGFTPPKYLSSAGYTDPRQRLQAGQIGRTISGRAEPGTFVRLVEGFGDIVVAEVLVDSSGIYRFENIKDDNEYLGSYYRVLLYPQGRLTEKPEIRDANYTAAPGQLPSGATAFVVSGGLQRDFKNQGLIGNFSGFRGGVAQRWGVSENLTVGFGAVYDSGGRGLAELFYRPANFPLQIAVSTLVGSKTDTIADIRFEPSTKFSASFSTDRFSSRLNLNWNILNGVSLFANSDIRSGTGGGLQFNFSGRDLYTFARIGLDTENRLRWTWLQRLGKLELTQFGNEIGTFSELNYGLSPGAGLGLEHSLVLNYETRSQNGSNNLLTAGWRYRSPQLSIDGNYLWDAQLGYAFGSQGSGLIAVLSTNVMPGLSLRARYQGISVTSEQSSFNIDLVSSLGLQRGITPGDRRTNYFRTLGGLLIQPFFDDNNNGKKDPGEKIYIEAADTLLTVNNRVIKSLNPEVQSDRLLLRLNPGIYRLDLDPAGFPPDWQAATDAYKVDVVSGSYTPVLLPLIRSYTVSGVITNTEDVPVNGAQIEAISTTSKPRKFSVTNTAGVYYIEGLQQGSYRLSINGKIINNFVVTLDNLSQGLQEINLKQGQNKEFQVTNPNIQKPVSLGN